VPRAEILTYEEIAHLARIAAQIGIEQIRLTGGEPTVRRDLPELIRMLREIAGLQSLSLTTNGVLLDSAPRGSTDILEQTAEMG
jgi:cyclic pyranopterin phosphate synthase